MGNERSPDRLCIGGNDGPIRAQSDTFVCLVPGQAHALYPTTLPGMMGGALAWINGYRIAKRS